jgi:hypothetical protein
MLQTYLPIYKIALTLQSLRTTALLLRDGVRQVPRDELERFRALIGEIRQRCPEYGLDYTAAMAERTDAVFQTYGDIFPKLDHLNDSLVYELGKWAVLRIPPERKNYYEHDELFGKGVAAAFPSCARDIRKAGNCYALGEEDACVHHLMLVLERGLNALAVKVVVPYQRTNWQPIINEIASKLKLTPKGPERDFLLEVNAQFGFLKDAYRNHSEHARDDPYDMEKALSILNHVRGFMQALQKGGLSE